MANPDFTSRALYSAVCGPYDDPTGSITKVPEPQTDLTQVDPSSDQPEPQPLNRSDSGDPNPLTEP